MQKVMYGNIELYTPAKRGYGTCTRIYDKATHKAIDFGCAATEYEHSLQPVEGEFEKICALLNKQDLKTVQTLLDLCGTYSNCSGYHLWDYAHLSRVIDGLTTPLPIDEILMTYEKVKTGNLQANKKLVKLSNHIFGAGTTEEIKNAHKFAYAFKAMYALPGGRTTALRYLYPNLPQIVEAVNAVKEMQLYKGKYYTKKQYEEDIPTYKITYRDIRRGTTSCVFQKAIDEKDLYSGTEYLRITGHKIISAERVNKYAKINNN